MNHMRVHESKHAITFNPNPGTARLLGGKGVLREWRMFTRGTKGEARIKEVYCYTSALDGRKKGRIITGPKKASRFG